MIHEDDAIPPEDPRYDGFRIETAWMFTVIDPKNDQEGMPAFQAQGGVIVPMVATDERRVADLRKIAQRMADKTGLEISLVQFTVREVLETIKPASSTTHEQGGSNG